MAYGDSIRWMAAASAGGGSLWTAGAGFIYYDGPTVIGQTTAPIIASATLTVKGKFNLADAPVIDVYSFGGGSIFRVNNTGQLSTTQIVTNGASLSGVVNHLRSTVNSSAPALRVSNAANTVLMDVQSGGFVIIPGRLVVGGAAVVSGAWNSIRSGGNTVGDSCLSVVNLANSVLMDIRSNGQIRLTQVLSQTTNPLVAGALWNDSGTLKISAG
jgi:hypothetical protein